MKIAGYKPAQIILLAVMLGACETSRAQISWAAAANGNWNTAASWSPAVVPGVGTNASIIVAGTYTVTYNSAMSAGSIASLTLGSNTSIPTLTLTAAGFNVAGTTTFVDTSAEVINVNSGGVMTNGTLAMTSRNAVVNVNTGGILTNGTTQVANNNSVDGANILKINSGATANLGAVTIGRHTQSSSDGLIIAGGTVSASSIDVGIRNSYANMAVSGGTVTNAGSLRLGTGSATAGREIRYSQTGGTVGCAGTVDLAVAGSYTVWFSVLNAGSTFYADGIRIFPNAVSSAVARLTNGGNMYLGAGGFKVLNTNLGSYTVALNDQSVLGATADWAANVNMVAPSGTITFKAADAAGTAHNLTLTNPISGGASLTKSGGGTLTLLGANTYAGNTTVGAGLLVLGNASALPKATALTLGGSGTTGILELGGFNIQISGLATGSGGVAANQLITNSSAVNTSTLTFSNSAANSTFGGVIAGGSKPVALTILGGNLTLSGQNTYAGNIFISNGKLALSGAGSTFTGAAIVLSNDAAILDLTGMNSLALASGQSLSGYGIVTGSVTAASCPITPGANGVASMLAIVGNLTLNGSVTNQFDLLLDPNAAGSDLINVNGALNVSGVNTIELNPLGGSLSAGTYKLIKCGSIGSGGPANFQITGSAGPSLQATISLTATSVDLTVTQTSGTDRVWAGDGVANLWDYTTTNWLNTSSPDLFADGNVVTFDNTGSTNPAVSLVGSLKPNTITVDATGDYTFSGSGKFSGATVLTKTNSGTLTILTDNAYTGLTIIAQGTVQVGNGGSSGSLGTAAIQDNGTLTWNQSDNDILGVPISGTGQLIQAGPGSLILSATNTYGGGTTISAGTLQISTGGSLGGGNITNNAALVFNSSGNNTVGSSISGSGSLTLSGSGTLTLTGNNSFSGGTTISNSTLLVNNTVGSGTGSGAVTVFSGGKLGGSGAIAGPVTINTGGTVNPGNGIGTLTVSNDFTANPGAIFNYALGANSNRTVVSGNLNLSGTLNLTDGGGLGNGTYTLFTYASNLVVGNFTLGTVPSGKLYQIDNSTPGQVNVIVGVIATNVPAFPGALGFGSSAIGGRGGKIYHVTTLADSGTGSFRDAVGTSGRIVVFDVGGYIALNTAVSVKGNITIAGQTAPGGGIGFKGGEISFANSANIICRHIRIRPGSDTASTGDDCLSLYQASNVILDHVSLEFGPWNNIDAVSCANITVQNSINANPTYQQFGAHTESVGQSYSWFYNIFANSHNRNPLAKINTVYINNILYNHSAGYTTHTSTPFKHDIINNYFICGPGSGGGGNSWFQIDNNQSIYFTGNLKDTSLDGVLNGSTTVPLPGYQGGGTILSAPWSTWTTNPNVTIYTPQAAYRIAVSQAGALPRDEMDSLLLGQIKTLGNGPTGTGAGTAGPGGGFYTSQTQTGLGNNGYGTINGGAPAIDSDGDGMPDFWEAAAGLDSNNSNDSTNLTLSGYSQLEIYLNWLAGPHVVANSATVNISLAQYASGFTNANPTYTVSSAINGAITLLPDGHTAQFSTPTNFIGRGSFNFVVAGNDGTRMTNTVGLVISAIPPPQDLVWRGDGTANIWDVGTNVNWLYGTNLTVFSTGDTVTFDDSGSNTPAINLTGTLKPSSVTVDASQNYTFAGSGILSGAMSLIKSGSGTLTLNTANSYGGGTVVLGGTVVVGSGADIGGGTLTLDGGALTSTYGSTANYNLGGVVNVPTTGTLNLSPRMTLNGISGGGVLNLSVSGTPFNYENLNGAAYSGFTGTLNVTGTVAGALLTANFNGGSFDGNLSGMLFNLDNVTLQGRHNSSGNTLTIGALSGTATSSLGGSGYAGNETIVIGGLNLNTTFAGSIANGVAVTTVSKTGTGTLTLNGTNNFTGGLTINNGGITVNGSTTAGTVNVVAGTLGGSGSIGGPVTLQSSTSLKPAGIFTITGNLTLTSAKLFLDLANVTTPGGGGNDLISISGGSLTLSGVSTISPNYLNGALTNGTYTLISGGSSTTGSAANLAWSGPTGARQTVSLNMSTPGAVLLNVSGSLPASLVWQGTNGNNWDLTTTNWLNGSAADKFFNVDSVMFNDSSTNGSVTVISTVQSGSIIVSNTTTSYTLSGGNLTGDSSLFKYGTGLLTVSSSNSFSGGTVINGGTIIFTNDVANVSGLGSGAITLNGGTLTMFDSASTANNAAWNLIVPASASGNLNADSRCNLSGSLTGGGTFNFNVTGTQTALLGDWSAFSGKINVTGGGEFRVLNFSGYPNATINFSNNVTANFQGAVDPNGTTLAIGELSGISSSKLLGGFATNGEVLTWNIGGLNTDATFAGQIAEQNTNAITAINKTGIGTWTLTGSNTFSGGMTVSEGTLQVNNTNGSATGTNQVFVATSATLSGSGIIGGLTAFDDGAILAPGNGIGTLTISNELDLSDLTALQFGLGTNSDKVVVSGNLVLGGQLNLAAAGGFGTATYTLFTYGGALTLGNLTVAAAPAGFIYAISTSTSGQINLIVTRPQFNAVGSGTGGVVMSGSGGAPNGIYYVLSSTNIALPLNLWTRLATNQFDASGIFNFTNVLNPDTPENFYQLQLP